MDDNTRFLKSILQQNWEAYDALLAEFESQGKGTPTAIIGFAFNLAVHRRFGQRRNMDEIIQFVADARTFLSEGRDLPAREAEALICATLDLDAPDVAETVDRLDIGTITEIEGQLLFKLIADEGMSEQQLNDFLAQAEALAAQWQSGATS
ncbi:hypothetical protein [Plantactinospora sp. BB1]|uniref:hypothetical protein n=1 Tax=Plantactinospora sp. BB1 TaxID=2071627 RepID=UPI000D165270|nr:hypothetical protein [Plantactinospora sp. BB1]AVT37279.1 hypothetical protein C6W10_13310 [Plantactinospora sp. BB1]